VSFCFAYLCRYLSLSLCGCIEEGEGGKRSSGIKNIFIVIKRTFFYYYYFASLSGTNDANYSNVSGRYFLFSASMSFRSCIYISAATRLCLELLVYYLLIAISVTKPISSVSQMILAPSPKLPALNRKCFLHSLPTNNEYSPVKQWMFYIVLRVPFARPSDFMSPRKTSALVRGSNPLLRLHY